MQVCTILFFVLSVFCYLCQIFWKISSTKGVVENTWTSKNIHQYDINFNVVEDCGIEMLIWLGFKKWQSTFNIVQHALLLKYITKVGKCKHMGSHLVGKLSVNVMGQHITENILIRLACLSACAVIRAHSQLYYPCWCIKINVHFHLRHMELGITE